MSGYIGSAGDAAQEIAMDTVDNGIHAARQQLNYGTVSSTHCLECGEEIPEGRRKIIQGVKYCVNCQDYHTHKTNFKMLTKML